MRTSLTAHNVPRRGKKNDSAYVICQGGSVSCIFGSLNTVCSRENLTEFWLYFFIGCLSCVWLSPVSGVVGLQQPTNKQTGLLLGEMPGSLWISPEWLSVSATNTHLLSIRLCSCGSEGVFRFLALFKTDLVRNNNWEPPERQNQFVKEYQEKRNSRDITLKQKITNMSFRALLNYILNNVSMTIFICGIYQLRYVA